MPYTHYSKQTGSAGASYLLSQQGWKNIPHVKAERRDTCYSASAFLYLAGNTEFTSLRSGGTLWNEQIPAADFSGSILYNGPFSFSSRGNQAYARAYLKFKDKVYTQASNLTALKERAKTIDMVVARLMQLAKGAKALKRGRFREFLETFGIKPRPRDKDRKWSRPKQFGSLWLEYWMGWAPTVGDVYSTLDFLGKPVPDQPVRAGSTVPFEGNYKWTSSPSTAFSSWKGTCTVWVKSKVEVTNPSLYDLQGLGLINPAKTLWETIAFSWFFDWFSNVGQVLGQITDWVGLKLKDLVVSCKTTAACSYVLSNAKSIFGASAPSTVYRDREITYFCRQAGGALPPVKPIVKLPLGLSLSRGATSVSLLVTMFAPKR